MMTVDNGIIHNTWQPVFSGIHQVNGFHGIVAVTGTLRNGLHRVAIYGLDNAVGERWVDELYEENANNGMDNCPITDVGGNTTAGATYRLQHETYSNRNTFSDLIQPWMYVYYYIEGCDPENGSELQ